MGSLLVGDDDNSVDSDDGNEFDVGESGLEDNGGSLSYIVTGEGKQFVRLKVTP